MWPQDTDATTFPPLSQTLLELCDRQIYQTDVHVQMDGQTRVNLKSVLIFGFFFLQS